MERFKVSDGPTVGFVAHLVEWLIHGEQLVEHITVVRLLFADACVRCIVAAGGIQSESVNREAYRMIPILELELAL